MRRVIWSVLIVVLLIASVSDTVGIGQFVAQAEAPHIVQIAAGFNYSLALFSDGSLYTWGDNDCGQLGDSTWDNKNVPTLIGTGYTAIAAGFIHSFALKDSALYAWGDNFYGRLGDGTETWRNTPTLIGTGYTAISAGYSHSLALKDSALYTWGYNPDGELGNETWEDKRVPTLIGTGYTAISAGDHYTLALQDSALYACGYNSYGELGDGTTTVRTTPTPIDTGYTAIAAGYFHSLALKSSALYAWGNNDHGQLGDGTTTNRNTPTKIGTGYTAMAAGYFHSLALKGSALYAWGDNRYGQLGNGTKVNKNAPILIGTGYTAIAAGTDHSLALKGCSLYAWGNNDHGQLGDGTTTNRNTPTRIDFPGLSTPTPDPLTISDFSVKNANWSIGDKAVFTVETGKNVKLVRLYDQNSNLVASTKSYKSKGNKRIWTITPVMAASGEFRYHAVAVNGSKVGATSAEVSVNVSNASLAVKGFTINSSALNVGETVTFKVTTGKLASKVSILDASNQTFSFSSRPSKTTSTQKIWTLQRKLTEGDMGSFALRAQVGSKYGNGPVSAALSLTVADGLPRIISVTPEKVAVKRGTALNFLVVTNAAATSVWISNDKKEKWQQSEVESTLGNRRTWRVLTLPRQLGTRKFYAQTYQGNLPSPKIFVRKIKVIK